jgi:hypothetical protein
MGAASGVELVAASIRKRNSDPVESRLFLLPRSDNATALRAHSRFQFGPSGDCRFPTSWHLSFLVGPDGRTECSFRSKRGVPTGSNGPLDTSGSRRRWGEAALAPSPFWRGRVVVGARPLRNVGPRGSLHEKDDEMAPRYGAFIRFRRACETRHVARFNALMRPGARSVVVSSARSRGRIVSRGPGVRAAVS